MDQCVYCKAQTELYKGGVPICLKCSNVRTEKQKPQASEREVLYILQQEYKSATEQGLAAIEAFDDAIEIPSRGPNPERINSASRRVSEARAALICAHERLEDFTKRGIVPEDLKWSG